MKKKTPQAYLSEYNSIIRENDEIYREAAKTLGLSDCTFWILYTLWEQQGALSQSELCSALYQPKQTVNSALKKMEREGCVRLTEMKDRRNKQVALTEKGKTLARDTVELVLVAEEKAYLELEEEEQEKFIALFHKYTDLLRGRMQEWEQVRTASPWIGE